MRQALRWVVRRWWLIAGVIVLLAVGWRFSAYARGTIDAVSDHARGRYEVKGYGSVVPWVGEYTRLMRERYGVRINFVAGCVVPEDLVRYVAGYNDVSMSLLRKRFGKDIFKECIADARTAWEQNHGKN